MTSIMKNVYTDKLADIVNTITQISLHNQNEECSCKV